MELLEHRTPSIGRVATLHRHHIHVTVCVIETEIPESVTGVTPETKIKPVIERQAVVVDIRAQWHFISSITIKIRSNPHLGRQREAVAGHAGPKHIDFPLG